ncbi:MAG: hypothetical protein ACYC5O_18300 [Anaerolineae bacterium]
MRRGMLRYVPVFAAILLLVAAGPLVTPTASAGPSAATAVSTTATAAAAGQPSPAPPVASATAEPYPTPDLDFPDQLAPRLQAAFRRGASAEELQEVASSFARDYFRVYQGEVFACGDRGPVVVNAMPPEGHPWYTFTYLFWQDSEGEVQYQALDRDGSGDLGMAISHPPQSAYVTGGDRPEMSIVAGGPFLGQDDGGAFYLLRLEDGAWRVVWDYSDAVEAGLWATRYARAWLVDGDTLVLRGAVPPAESVARFFDETIHHAYQQEFLSLWERRGDEYVRVAGQVIESPMHALTEFMVALTQGELGQAAERATEPGVVDEALAQEWDSIVGADVMAWSELWRPVDEQTLVFGPKEYWGGILEPPYHARMVFRDGRWLVAEVWSVPLETRRPTVTPEPTATATPIPRSPTATATRDASAFADTIVALQDGRPLDEVAETYAAEVIAELNRLIDPDRPLAEQREALAELRAGLPSMGRGEFGEGEGRAVPADLDEEADPELIIVAKQTGLPMLYVRYHDGAWDAVAMPVALPEQSGEVAADFGVRPESARSLDMSADDRPEALVSHLFFGASNTRELLQVLHWNGTDFDVYFRAELVTWAGESTWELGTDLGQEHITSVTLTYPYLFTTGFEAKLVPHPLGVEWWEWDAEQGQYVFGGRHATIAQSVRSGSDVPEWEVLRVLVNQAEESYQAGDLERALEGYAGYQGVLAEAATMERPAGRAANWPAYARFRTAEVEALLGGLDAARAGLEALAEDLSPDSNLLPLVEALRTGLDGSGPDAALRAVASLHSLGLYESFYRLSDAPADLTFPMNMTTVLWPGTPLALDLQNRRLQIPAPPEMTAEPLLDRWSDLGFPVAAVEVRDLNDDGAPDVLVTLDESDQEGGARATWLLVQDNGWWRSYLPCGAGDLAIEVSAVGDTVLRCEAAAYRWSGRQLMAVDPGTFEPLWPVVGWW